MTPDTRTALETLRAQVEARMGSHDQAAMRTGEVAYAARSNEGHEVLGLIDALLSTSPGESEPPLIRVGDVVYLAGFGLRHVSTQEAAKVLTGNDGVDGVYHRVWKREGSWA